MKKIEAVDMIGRVAQLDTCPPSTGHRCGRRGASRRLQSGRSQVRVIEL